jgi:hypothetical protein
VENFNHVLKDGIKKLLPSSIVEYIRKKRQIRNDEHWFEQKLLPYLTDAPERSAEYEKRSQDLLSKYHRIEFCEIVSHRFGEIIVLFYLSQEFPSQSGEMTLFVPVGEIPDEAPGTHFLYAEHYIANISLFHKVSERIPVLVEKDFGFWCYFIKNHRDRVYYSRRYDFENRMVMNSEFIRRKAYQDICLTFTPEEQKRGREELLKMGIQGEYVCFFSRTFAYLEKVFKIDCSETLDCFRNSNIENFTLMCEQMQKKGIQSIRMGKFVDAPFSAPGAIDYASKYSSPFMDLYLSANAKCFVSDCSAIQLFASLFHKPLVLTNTPIFTMKGDAVPYFDATRDILLPKKFLDTRRKRYLTLREILEIEKQEDHHVKVYQYYKSHGIISEENSPEEIAAATNELLERMNDTVEYTSEDIAMQGRVLELLEWAAQGRDCFVYDVPIARDFLRNNPWYLE